MRTSRARVYHTILTGTTATTTSRRRRRRSRSRSRRSRRRRRRRRRRKKQNPSLIMRVVPIEAAATILSFVLFFVDGSTARAAAEDGAVLLKKKYSNYRNTINNNMMCLRLFEDSVFIYPFRCGIDMMVGTTCDSNGGACYIWEQAVVDPLDVALGDILTGAIVDGEDEEEDEEEEEEEEEEYCFIAGSFDGEKSINYNHETGDCELMYTAISEDTCGTLPSEGGRGFSSLGMKARINIRDIDVIYILYTSDKGKTYYNDGEEREAFRQNSDAKARHSNRIKNNETQGSSLQICPDKCKYARFIPEGTYLSSSQCGEVVQTGGDGLYCFDATLVIAKLGGLPLEPAYKFPKGDTCAEAGYKKLRTTSSLDAGSIFGTFTLSIFEK